MPIDDTCRLFDHPSPCSKDPTVLARGWCDCHYRRWRAHGDPLGGRTSPKEPIGFITRLLASRPWPSECVPWPYATNLDGRGVVSFFGMSFLAHRLILMLRDGCSPWPKLQACHTCGNGHLGCVNPGHLYWGTQKDNEADKIAHGTKTWGEQCGGSVVQSRDHARDIYLDAWSGRHTQREVAERHGATVAAVCHIKYRRSWAWATADL